MILIKSFLTRVMYGCFKLIYASLHKGYKVYECYSCLKMIVQAHLHVGILTIFFITRASLKWFYLQMKLLQSSTIFKQKKSWSILRLKFLHGTFYNPQCKKYNFNSTHSYNRKIWVDITFFHVEMKLKFFSAVDRK